MQSEVTSLQEHNTHSQSQVESSQMLCGEISHSLPNLLRC